MFGSGRTCTKCKQFKKWDEYYKDGHQKTGYRPNCKQCIKYSNTSLDQKIKAKDRNLFKDHKLTLEKYVKILFEDQKGLCAVCGKEAPAIEEMFFSLFWPVDHDHYCCPQRKESTCGKCIRGILCWSCNKELTIKWENAVWREKALNYLKGVKPC